jgi:hypothetical protein
MIATRPSAQSMPPMSVAKMPGPSLPGSCSCGRNTSCPAASRAAVTSAFQARSAVLKSGPAKYSFMAGKYRGADDALARTVRVAMMGRHREDATG